jgi:hypothetical protein
MLHNPANNPQGTKVVTYRSSMPPSVTVRQWVIYHLLAARGSARPGAHVLRPPEYRDLLQLRLSDVREVA